MRKHPPYSADSSFMARFTRTSHIDEMVFQNDLVLRYPEFSETIQQTWDAEKLKISEYDTMIVFYYSLDKEKRNLVSSLAK